MKAVCLRHFSGLLGFAIAAIWSGPVEAATLILGGSNQPILIGATTMSRYDENGLEFNDALAAINPNVVDPIGNTLTGFRDGVENRSYFVFNISSLQEPVSDLSLRLLNKRFYSTESTEIVDFYDVDPDTIGLNPNISLVTVRDDNAFEDLGTGVRYGSAVVVGPPSDDDFDNLFLEDFEVNLDAALADLNQAIAESRTYFAIGASLNPTSSGSPYEIQGLNSLPVEGVLFSGGPRDTEVPDRDVLDLGPLNPDPSIAVSEPKQMLGLLALGITGGVAKMRSRRH
ncbi:MAG: hypothetical protein AAF827_03085 [Cyanobacteria bacterium P01_D01_bin.6]